MDLKSLVTFTFILRPLDQLTVYIANHAVQSLVTVPVKGRIIWSDPYLNRQHARNLGHDDLWLLARTSIDGLIAVLSTQFQSQGFIGYLPTVLYVRFFSVKRYCQGVISLTNPNMVRFEPEFFGHNCNVFTTLLSSR